jgi:hypothetical protein
MTKTSTLPSYSPVKAMAIHPAKTRRDGPLFLAKDTHALSEPAFASALEVLAANGVDTMIDSGGRLHAHARALARHPDLQSPPGRACALPAWPTAS